MSEGSTITGNPFNYIQEYLFKKIEYPSRIEILKESLITSIREIYDFYPKFKQSSNHIFEDADFANFSDNENWLVSLRPIWHSIYHSLKDINWNRDDVSIRDDIITQLNLSETSDRLTFLEDINEHLSTASNLLEDYCINLESNLDEEECMRIWAESWDMSDESKGILEPIYAETVTWQIKQLAKLAKDGDLDVDPIYQRDLVWNNKDSQKLINSILLGIPLPSIILHEINDGEYQIIDGKQRITSILKFIGAHPKAQEFMTGKMSSFKFASDDVKVKDAQTDYLAKLILSGNQEAYPFTESQVPRYKKWKGNKKYGIIGPEEKRIANKYCPFALSKKDFNHIPQLSHLGNKYYHEIREIEINIGKKKHRIKEIFEDESNYKIPVIIYGKETKPRQIRAVFHRYNKQGMSLNATEVNNATYQSTDAMRLVMAISRIRPERGEEILPGIYDSSVGPDSKKIESLFKAAQIGDKRYLWAHLNSIILAMLFHQIPRQKNGGLNYPSTAAFISKFLESELAEAPESRKISKNANCSKLAEILGESAAALNSPLMWDIFQNNPNWSSKEANGKWSQPAMISMFVASVICHSSGTKLIEKIEDNEIHSRFEEYLSSQEPLGQTQANLQWDYYARIVTEVCQIFGINKDNYEDEFELFYDYNLLEYFKEIIEDQAV